MNYFTKNKMLFWCVAVLVILNVATLTSFWMKRPPERIRNQPGRVDGQKLMAERLQLTDEQARQVERIRREHFQRSRPLQDEMHGIRLDLLDELFAADPDPAAMEQMLKDLENKQGQFEAGLYRHFEQLRDVCDPQQAQELRLMLIDLIERTRPRDPQQQLQGPAGAMGPGHRVPPLRPAVVPN